MDAIEKACNQVYRQFPELSGTRPSVKKYGRGGKLLIFSGKATTADGRSMTRTVRVVVDENGSIGKMTTSR